MQEWIIDILFLFVLLAGVLLLVLEGKKEHAMNKKQKKMLVRIVLATFVLLCGEIGLKSLEGELHWSYYCLFYFCDYLIIGYDILWKACKGIKNRQVFDECFLMSIATVGAFGLALYEQSNDYTEAIAVMLFYQIGEWFQSYAVGKSRGNISKLMDIRPDYANIEKNGQLVRVDPDEVAVGEIIVVQPGEKVAIDGIVVEGKSSLNTSALTGESLPRDVKEKDEIISGCINLSGVLKIQTSKEFCDSTVSKILDLVENASSRKSHSENFISKFARIYTPAVCISAFALAFLPPLAEWLFALTPQWEVWIYRALTFLVISCPCALVISIPLTFFAGIGGASSAGVLVKGSNYLETLSQTKIVVFDKTGTLTQGVFAVRAIHHCHMSEEKLIEYAALAESASNHPIAKSLQKAYGKAIDRTRVKNVEEISGNGVRATVDGSDVLLGNEKMMERFHIDSIPCHSLGTIIHVAVDGVYAGHIVISDIVKAHAKEAIDQLRQVGMRKMVMLTGDRENVAQAVAFQLGIDEVYSELLPADKVSKVEDLLQTKANKEKLAFIGDGINDAPVLRRADIGIAMGAMGSDAAIEAADVVLMDDDPLKIAKAIKISRKCLRIVYQNIVFAIGVKLLCLLLGALGIANMWLAIFADVGVMVLAVLNAIRALFVQKL